jgi:hypothetical protein
MKAFHACCNSSYSVEMEGLGKSSRVGETSSGILGSLDKGLTLECTLPGLWTMTSCGKAANTRPQAASLLLCYEQFGSVML